jgi:DNA-binding NarL/FixJ family response regulator
MKQKKTTPGNAHGKQSGQPYKKILLVEDHPMTRAGLAQLIRKQPDLRVCGEARDPNAAFQELARTKPDLILADLSLPGHSGLEFIKDVLTLYSGLPILVVSMHDELIYAERVLRTGARGYIMKEADAEELLAAIRRVLSGQVYVSERMSARLLDSLSTQPRPGAKPLIEKLTDREFEVFELIGQGKSTREIARQLHRSPKTVDVHRGRIKGKLKLTDATALVRYAVRWVEAQTQIN